MWRVLNSRNHSTLVEKAINPDFARRVNLEKRVGEYNNNNNSRFNNFRQKHWRNIDSGLTSYSLELLDKTAATFSLDTRYPFYDWRLIKFCLALPPRQILSNGMTRVIFRRAMAGVIPEDVRWRTTKADLSVNFRYGLFTYERLIIEQVILNDPQYIEPYFDIQSLKNTYQRYITQPLISMRTAQIVYNAVILDRWLHSIN
jgi:asparagine synthase (glutamine-hydrolysing)